MIGVQYTLCIVIEKAWELGHCGTTTDLAASDKYSITTRVGLVVRNPHNACLVIDYEIPLTTVSLHLVLEEGDGNQSIHPHRPVPGCQPGVQALD